MGLVHWNDMDFCSGIATKLFAERTRPRSAARLRPPSTTGILWQSTSCVTAAPSGRSGPLQQCRRRWACGQGDPGQVRHALGSLQVPHVVVHLRVQPSRAHPEDSLIDW